MRQLLFLHGAGGFSEDGPLADALGAELGARVVLPRLPDDDMSYAAWAAVVRPHLDALEPHDVLVAHSFGASVLLRVLGEDGSSPERAALLAMPDWGPDGWDVAEYAYDGPPAGTVLTLHHCRDDEVVPFAHLSVHASRLPGARVVDHASGGHQFDGRVAELAADLRTSR